MKVKLEGSVYGFRENTNTTIEITIKDLDGNDELDLFTAFAVNDKYFAHATKFDDHFAIAGTSGQFVYPYRGSNLAQDADLENAFLNANTHNADVALTTTGNKNDWDRVVTNTDTTDRSLLIYTITNDAPNNSTSFNFRSGTSDYTSTYSNAFDFDSNIYFYIQLDCRYSVNENARFYTFDIKSTINTGI